MVMVVGGRGAVIVDSWSRCTGELGKGNANSQIPWGVGNDSRRLWSNRGGKGND